MIIKTDWQNGEEFDIHNYNRMKNNINETYELVLEMFPQTENVEIEDKDYTSYYFIESLNDVENNLKAMIDAINIPDLFEPTKTFNNNALIWDASDINRIERTTLLINETLEKLLNQKFRYSGTFYSGEDWGFGDITYVAPQKHKILKEDGNKILLENGNYLIKESE